MGNGEPSQSRTNHPAPRAGKKEGSRASPLNVRGDLKLSRLSLIGDPGLFFWGERGLGGAGARGAWRRAGKEKNTTRMLGVGGEGDKGGRRCGEAEMCLGTYYAAAENESNVVIRSLRTSWATMASGVSVLGFGHPPRRCARGGKVD